MLEPRIDDYPELKAQLGKARTDRIRAYQKCTGRRQPAATNLDNPLQEQLTYLDHIPPAVDDILTGVIALIPTGDKPLSMKRLFTMLQCLSLINTHEVQRMMDLGERHARKYMQAAKIALPLLIRHFNKHSLPPAIGQTQTSSSALDDYCPGQFTDVYAQSDVN
ncbi:MAG: hypothetical protein Q7W55_15185 [Pseudohongiella sp.]|nr:hypothetical protein [Pseudohongiella sp.]